jgi:hypothetical protein
MPFPPRFLGLSDKADEEEFAPHRVYISFDMVCLIVSKIWLVAQFSVLAQFLW